MGGGGSGEWTDETCIIPDIIRHTVREVKRRNDETLDNVYKKLQGLMPWVLCWDIVDEMLSRCVYLIGLSVFLHS